mmetsp:Transcript_128047/g.356344  ORF Transcript_128047/g.356344 Transcript_128047/m.356344 type:complete len:219 (-) Transcript_128047:39-695(-)
MVPQRQVAQGRATQCSRLLAVAHAGGHADGGLECQDSLSIPRRVAVQPAEGQVRLQWHFATVGRSRGHRLDGLLEQRCSVFRRQTHCGGSLAPRARFRWATASNVAAAAAHDRRRRCAASADAARQRLTCRGIQQLQPAAAKRRRHPCLCSGALRSGRRRGHRLRALLPYLEEDPEVHGNQHRGGPVLQKQPVEPAQDLAGCWCALSSHLSMWNTVNG